VQGVVVNVLNPKTALFFLAFLPQFVDRDHGSVPLQVGLLGLVFATIALCSDALYALLSDLLAVRLRRSAAGARLRRYLSGGIFIALGATAAVARRSS
jgi:threonine/homoserine/homoserine lactone efflux protein